MNHNRMRKVGVDLDDVMFAFAKAWKSYSLLHFGKEGTLWWETEEEVRQGHQFIASSHHLHIEAIEGAFEGLIKLIEQNYSPVGITARDFGMELPTRILFERHFRKISRVKKFHVPLYFMHQNMEIDLGSKGEICTMLGVTDYLDDSLHHLLGTHAQDINSYHFIGDHNRTVVTPPEIHRTHSWNEFLYQLKHIP